MSTLPKLVTFLLWIAVYSSCTVLIVVLNNRLKYHRTPSARFLMSLQSILLGQVWIHSTLILIGGFFSPQLILLWTSILVIVSIIGFIPSIFSRRLDRILGISDVIGFDFGLRYNKFVVPFTRLNIFVFFAFPILIGIIYFISDRSDPDLQTLILQVVLVYMLIFAMISTPFIFAVFLSRFMDQSSRNIYLLSRISGLLASGLTLSILFSAFGVSDDRYAITIGGMSLGLSVPLVVSLMIAFICWYFLPYAIGTHRFSQDSLERLQERRAVVGNIYDAIRRPSGATYDQQLLDVKHDVEATIEEREKAISLHNFFKFFDEHKDDFVNTSQQTFVAEAERLSHVYDESSDMDPVFQHEQWMRSQVDLVEQIRGDLARRASEESKENAARGWSESIREDIAALDREAETARQRRPITLALAGLAMPVFSAILGELGKSLWKVYLEGLTK